jgi:hypothetical protein
MTIKNDYYNIELTSPIYFIKDTTCHIHLPQRVSSKSIMKANFVTGIDQDTLGGVLLYHVERKEDTSTSAQLLVIWGYSARGLYSNAYLIEHESTLTWNEEKLKMLYNVYGRQPSIYLDIDRYLLDDNTVLGITRKTSYAGDFGMNIIISEKIGFYSIKPLWVDPNR